MRNWSFWDWLTYICIATTALILALDQAIKGSPTFPKDLSGLLAAPSWNYAPLTLIIVSGLLLLLKQLNWIGKDSSPDTARPDESSSEVPYIKTSLMLQFFGDHRIPQEISSENVGCWFAFFSPSLSITPLNEKGDPIEGKMQVPPNWVIFIALDKPAQFRQAIVTFSNPEAMPIADMHMANSRVIAFSTRGPIPAGALTIQVVE